MNRRGDGLGECGGGGVGVVDDGDVSGTCSEGVEGERSVCSYPGDSKGPGCWVAAISVST